MKLDRCQLPGSVARRFRTACLVLLVLAVAALALRPARALNQRVYPLGELMKQSESIAIGRAVAVEVPRMRAALVIDEELKGKLPYRWMALNVAPGGWGHPPAMIRRLAPGTPVVFFGARVKGRHVVLGYTNGTWFQVTAPETKEPDRMPWTFTLCEIWLRRTFRGSTEELEQTVRDVLAGKREAPSPDLAATAGMGPEVPRSFKPDRPLPELPEHVARAMAAPKSGGATRKVPVRALAPEEQKWVAEAAKKFGRTSEETAMLLAQASYKTADAQRALELERDFGRGGNRGWVRSAEEILELKQRSDRLCWLDVRGVLMRAGELFTPVTDPVDLIHSLRTKFTWDELDPLFDDDKWGRKKLHEEIERRLAERLALPLAAGEKTTATLLDLGFGSRGSGGPAVDSTGWRRLPGTTSDLAHRHYDWDGGTGGSQRPGAIKFESPGSARNPLSNQPPKPGIPLAAGAGAYTGSALWFATSSGDPAGRGAGAEGSLAYYDRGYVRVRPGESRSFLVTAQVYAPDHTDAVGEPRKGWFYSRRPSRYIDAGIRLVGARTRASLIPDDALCLKVEPAVGKFDRVVLRVEFITHQAAGKSASDGGTEVRVIAFADGIGEVARTTVELSQAVPGGNAGPDEGVLFSPVFGTRRPADGYVPELYLASVRVQQIGSGAVDVVRGAERASGQ